MGSVRLLLLGDDQRGGQLLGLLGVGLPPLLERHGELGLDLLPVLGSGVVGAERYDTEVRGDVVDSTAPDPLDVVVVVVLEVHSSDEHHLPGELGEGVLRFVGHDIRT